MCKISATGWVWPSNITPNFMSWDVIWCIFPWNETVPNLSQVHFYLTIWLRPKSSFTLWRKKSIWFILQTKSTWANIVQFSRAVKARNGYSWSIVKRFVSFYIYAVDLKTGGGMGVLGVLPTIFFCYQDRHKNGREICCLYAEQYIRAKQSKSSLSSHSAFPFISLELTSFGLVFKRVSFFPSPQC